MQSYTDLEVIVSNQAFIKAAHAGPKSFFATVVLVDSTSCVRCGGVASTLATGIAWEIAGPVAWN